MPTVMIVSMDRDGKKTIMYEQELAIALKSAEAAGTVQLEMIDTVANHVQIKGDRSPVTAVDKRCEELVRDMLLKEFPGDGFLGEETGSLQGRSGRRWIVDPLDGTRPYIHGIPTFSVLIALENEDRSVVGVIHLPGMKETCWGTRGKGAFSNGRAIHVSTTNDPSRIFGSAIGFIDKAGEECADQLLALMKTWDYCYGFMDAYTYACIAAGKVDACVNLLDKPWDCAAAACIIPEAGGRFSDIMGNETIYSGTVIASNGIVHDHLVSHFSN